MFTKCSEPHLKERIVSGFVNPQSRLQVVIATVAFGMGLDCPCVREIIHWNRPKHRHVCPGNRTSWAR